MKRPTLDTIFKRNADALDTAYQSREVAERLMQCPHAAHVSMLATHDIAEFKLRKRVDALEDAIAELLAERKGQ